MKLDELRERAREDQTRFTAKVLRQVLDLLDQARADLSNANYRIALTEREKSRLMSTLMKANEEIRGLKTQLGRDRRRKYKLDLIK